MSLRQLNKVKARAAILAAATELVSQRGVDQATTREIAKRAGISYQTLYNYFPNKGLIIQEILYEEWIRWSSMVDQTIKHYSSDLLGTLDELNRISLQFSTGANQDLWREITTMVFRKDFINNNELSAKVAMAHERYHALLSMAQGMGHLKPEVDLHLLAHTLFCLTDYAILRFFVLPIDPEQYLNTLSEQTKLVVAPYLTDNQH
ncbi:MAG: TetR/AcrR family transcriptional regulator [Gammaproteobacteria bacterium]|nr:TetR/AcrR family transcriptional regulator [Gammaproteobacteria bacterium]